MAKTFHLPDLGEGLTEASIVSWHVAVGDVVAVDQPIVEVESAKAVVELPCPYAGTVVELHGGPGDLIQLDGPLITVDTGDGSSSPASGPGEQASSSPAATAAPGPEFAADEAPTPDEIAMSLPFLRRHIELAAPDVIVLMGNTPCAAALGREGITRLRGTWTEAFGLPALPMTHPAYLLRQPAAKREAWADLLEIAARLDLPPV